VKNLWNSPFIAGNKKLFIMGYNMKKHKSQEKIFWTRITRITRIEYRGVSDRIYMIVRIFFAFLPSGKVNSQSGVNKGKKLHQSPKDKTQE